MAANRCPRCGDMTGLCTCKQLANEGGKDEVTPQKAELFNSESPDAPKRKRCRRSRREKPDEAIAEKEKAAVVDEELSLGSTRADRTFFLPQPFFDSFGIAVVSIAGLLFLHRLMNSAFLISGNEPLTLLVFSLSFSLPPYVIMVKV